MKKILLFTSFVFGSIGLSLSQCGVGQSELYLTTSGGNWLSEKWVNITTEPNGAGTVIWAQGDGNYGNGAGLVTDVPFCVNDGVTYYINTYDSFDDGWDGTVYAITDQFSFVVANNGGASPNDLTDLDAGGSFEDPAIELESSEAFSYTPSSCAPVNNLAVDALTSSSADVSWNENGTATSWNIEWGVPGFTPGTATEIGSDNSIVENYTIGGLTPVTDYQFYIQADCGGGNLSNWTGPFSFSTLCDVYTPDYTQPFNTFLPDDCWSVAYDGEVVDGPLTPGFSDWIEETTIGNTVKINLYSSNNRSWALSPLFDLTGGGFEVVLDVAVTDWNNSDSDAMDGDDEVQLLYSEDGVTWNNLMTWNASNALPNTLTTFNTLIPSTGTNVQFAIFASDGTTSGSQDYDFHFDNFIIRTPPLCPQITGITNTDLTSTTADFTWTAGGIEAAWNVEWGVDGFTPGTATELGSDNTLTESYSIGGLTPETSYDFYVQADCDGDGLSVWTGPYSFYTGYCIVEGTDPTYHINNFSTTGGISNISNLNSGASPGGYQNATAMVVSQFDGGGPISFNANFVGGTFGFNIWVDWNNDLVFDNVTEKMFGSAGYVNPSSGSFNLPGGTPIGEYRMRIVANWLDTDPDACGSSAYLEAEDYTFEVIAQPPCLPVTAVTIDSTAADAFLISWTPGGTEGSWNIEYGEEGFVQGTGTTDVVTSPEILIQGLDPYTTYTIYIQADCSGDESVFTSINGTTNLGCGSVFTDTGGDTGNYSNGENLSWEVCAPSADEYVSVNFTEFQTEAGWDYFTIYSNGDFVGEYDGSNSPGIVNSTLGGCLTFEFSSDGSIADLGWVASITCETCSSSTPGIDGQEDFCYLAGTVDLENIITPGEVGGSWEFPTDSGLLTGSTLDISTLAAGSYDAYYLYAAIDGCDFDTTVATVNVFAASNAGENSLVEACINSFVDMFDAFTSPVDLDGTWYDPANQPTSATFGTGGMTGLYNYTYVASNGVCPNDTSDVVLQLLDCVASIEESTLTSVSVYPNPSNGLVYISGEFDNENFSYEVTDLNGRLIANATKIVDGAITIEINLSEKENGIYIVRLKSNDSERFVRIVKQ